jgi:ABC-type lipoprotein release transport system permease subunit
VSTIRERVSGTFAFLRATAAAIPQTSRSLRRAPGFVAIATLALGAGRRDVMRLVLSDGLVVALGGTVVGAIFGMWGGFLLGSFRFGVSPVDAQALVIAEAILFSVTMASCIAPALRTTRADPLEILRAT